MHFINLFIATALMALAIRLNAIGFNITNKTSVSVTFEVQRFMGEIKQLMTGPNQLLVLEPNKSIVIDRLRGTIYIDNISQITVPYQIDNLFIKSSTEPQQRILITAQSFIPPLEMKFALHPLNQDAPAIIVSPLSGPAYIMNADPRSDQIYNIILRDLNVEKNGIITTSLVGVLEGGIPMRSGYTQSTWPTNVDGSPTFTYVGQRKRPASSAQESYAMSDYPSEEGYESTPKRRR